MGGPHAGIGALREALEAYGQVAPIKPGDHVISAANPRLMTETAGEFSVGRLLVGYGPDGADRALLGELQSAHWIAGRYDEVVIGSGDGIFGPAVRRLRELGVAVGVVGLQGHVSGSLMASATFVRLLPSSGDWEVAA